MAAVKLGRSRQVTIPKKLMDEMNLRIGDYFEVERQGNRIILTPKVLVDQEAAKARLKELIEKAWKHNKGRKAEEIEAIVTQAIREVRAVHRADKKPRPKRTQARS